MSNFHLQLLKYMTASKFVLLIILHIATNVYPQVMGEWLSELLCDIYLKEQVQPLRIACYYVFSYGYLANFIWGYAHYSLFPEMWI